MPDKPELVFIVGGKYAEQFAGWRNRHYRRRHRRRIFAAAGAALRAINTGLSVERFIAPAPDC